MNIIDQINLELKRIGAHHVVCWELFPGEELFQLVDEQWESEFMYSDRILDFLCDIIDNVGGEGLWDYLRFKHVPLVVAPQKEDWLKFLRQARLEKKG